MHIDVVAQAAGARVRALHDTHPHAKAFCFVFCFLFFVFCFVSRALLAASSAAKRGGNGDTTSLHVIICKLLIKVAAHTSRSTGATIIGVIAFRVVQRISATAAKSS
jgi:hypothetical protein